MGSRRLQLFASLALVAPAQAATLSVDDDGEDCPAATFSSVQAALDAANAGDTVAICPGTYREGSGAVAARTTGSASPAASRSAAPARIYVTVLSRGAALRAAARSRATSPSLQDASGDVVWVAGGYGVPITVDISGVTIDGGGVYVEAGVVYRDAQGTINRSRVTNVVTTEAADGYADDGRRMAMAARKPPATASRTSPLRARRRPPGATAPAR